MVHGFGAVYRTAAGRNHMIRTVERQDHFFFDPPQNKIAMAVDDSLQGTFFPQLDQNVGIDEIHGQAFSQKDADRALAGSRHADQNKVRILSGPIRWPIPCFVEK